MKLILISMLVLSFSGVAMAKEKAGEGMRFCSCGSKSLGAGQKYECSKSVLCTDCCNTTQTSSGSLARPKIDLLLKSKIIE